MLSVAELLETRAHDTGPALIEGSTGLAVTWAEVGAQAQRWTDARPAGPVGLALADPVAMATNFIAALRAGALVAPLDPAAPVADHEARIAQLGLRSIVLEPGLDMPGGVEAWTAGRRDLERTGGTAGPVRDLPAEPTQVRAIMASSGTTGTPKIIPLTEPQLLATARGVATHLALGPEDRGYSPLPLFHINGLVIGVLSALVAGSSIVLERQFSRRSFWTTAELRGATWLNLVPAILAILAAPAGTEEPRPRKEIRLARSASAPLPQAVRERFEYLTGIPVVETYGMTEAASQIAANPTDAVRPGSVGLPVDVDLRVVDKARRAVGVGETGRVQIRGPRVTSWYWNVEKGEDRSRWSSRPALESDGWLDTGDIGCQDGDGYLYLVGRDGDVINRGGEKIQPREVEELLLGDPRVTAAAVVGRPHPTVGEEPVAYVLATEAALVDSDQLVADLNVRCERSLSRFKRPAEIVVARWLPAGPTGKVRRAEVRAMALSSREVTERQTADAPESH